MTEEQELDDSYIIKGNLHTYAQVKQVSLTMKHGEIRGMLNWCARQGKGVDPPWQFRRIGPVPIPWLGVFAIVLVFASASLGLGLGWAVNLGILSLLTVFTVTVFTAEYLYDRKGLCHNCGAPADKTDKIKKYDWKGNVKAHTQAGYCAECEWNYMRHRIWATVESQVWNGIEQNCINYRWYMAPFFLLFIAQKKFRDPRKVGRQVPYYIKKDRKYPRDTIDTAVFMEIELALYDALDAIRRLRKVQG